MADCFTTRCKFSSICYITTVIKCLCFLFVSFRGTYLERQTNKVGHAATGSVALPAVMRAGGPGTVHEYKVS